MKKRNTIITIVVLLVVVLVVYFSVSSSSDTPNSPDGDTATSTATSSDDASTSSDDVTDEDAVEAEVVIGSSVDGQDIVAYNFGTGDTHLLFVGGIHGGYSWNTSLLSYQLINHFQDNPDAIPENVSVTIIPALNPDGLKAVTGVSGEFNAADVSASQAVRVAARFNANNVDLNRNFACNWSETATWQSRSVNPGDGAFSEPEAQAMRNYIDANTPDAAVVFYSAAGSVYSSDCNGDVLAETDDLMNTYADASVYSAKGLFTAYDINGDMVNWMASQDIPAISVLLTDHSNAELSTNLAGVEAVLEMYAQ